MRNRNNHDQNFVERWREEGPSYNRENRNGPNDFNRNDDEFINRSSNIYRGGNHNPSAGGRNFNDNRPAENRNFGYDDNYDDNYGGSTLSGGGGGFGSPGDYGTSGGSGNYSGGYYGSSGSYGSGNDYRSGNYSSNEGAPYNSSPMQHYGSGNQSPLQGRTGYRSNYTSIRNEFDAVMEDPMTSSNFDPENSPHSRTYHDYNTEDNYGSMQGRYSNYNNYTGRRDYHDRGGSISNNRMHQYNQNHNEQGFIQRAAGTVRNWFGRNDHENDGRRW